MSTALLTAKPSDIIERSDVDMRMAAIRHLPVVDERNRLVGIVSDRDLLRQMSEMGTAKVRVSSVMSANPITTSIDDDAATAIELLLEHRISCLPVVGDEMELVGVVTDTDFLRFAHQTLCDEVEDRA